MSEFNNHLCQKAFEKYNSGLRREIEEIEFENKQQITNFVRSKMNKLFTEKSKRIFKKESVIRKLKQQLDEANKVIEFYDNAHVKDINIRMLKNKARAYQAKWGK